VPALIVVLALLLGTHEAVAGLRRAQANSQPATAAVGTYWCPMHPNIRGKRGDACPICHMALVSAPATDYAAYDLDIITRPPAPVPGRHTEFRLTIHNPSTHAPISEFELVHERKLHLFVVDQDLEFFAHVHPVLQSDGSFLQNAVLPRPGVYRLIADFLPAGGVPQVVQRSVVTAGFTGSLIPHARIAPDVAPKVVDDIRVTLSMPPAVAGREQLLTFEFANAASGRPVDDLEPYLGAVGHLLLVSADLQTVAHSHPVAEMSGSVGPTVVFQAMFPRAGMYRFWVQFQRGGRVMVAPFTVSAGSRE
jgi:hypothetical protein